MSHPITRSILNAYFPRVYSLQDYLNYALNSPTDTKINDILLLPKDPPSYGDFLVHSYVSFSDELPLIHQTRFDIAESFDSMRVVSHNLCPCGSAGNNEDPQVIARAQERLFAGPKQKGMNVITMGYRGVCIPILCSQTRPNISLF